MTTSIIEDYVEFNKDGKLGQNQYASRYIDGRHSSPNLGNGLRFIGDTRNYHDIKIHKDDVARFEVRCLVYKTLIWNGMWEQASLLVDKVIKYGESHLGDPSHYDYLTYFYSKVCENLGVEDRYMGAFTSNGDKMYQYRDRWEKAGVPWFHATVCYLLMDSVYHHEVRDTPNGWVDPAQWVIDNYKSGHNLFRGMIENHI